MKTVLALKDFQPTVRVYATTPMLHFALIHFLLECADLKHFNALVGEIYCASLYHWQLHQSLPQHWNVRLYGWRYLLVRDVLIPAVPMLPISIDSRRHFWQYRNSARILRCQRFRVLV